MDVIQEILQDMKDRGAVHPDAVYNEDADTDLRTEVAYRDRDFLWYMARSDDERIVDQALHFLKALNIVPASASYNKAAFESFRREIKECFKGSWTTFTPGVERLVYMLTALKRPKRLVECGSFWGNTLAWFAGPAIGASRQYEADLICGIEWREKWTEKAKENFAKLPNTEAVTLLAEDARLALEAIDGPIEFLYLEAHADELQDLYLDLVKRAYDKLPQGAWVIAHDVLDYDQKAEMKSYTDFVRDHQHFSTSITFDIDFYGLELSVK